MYVDLNFRITKRHWDRFNSSQNAKCYAKDDCDKASMFEKNYNCYNFKQ